MVLENKLYKLKKDGIIAINQMNKVKLMSFKAIVSSNIYGEKSSEVEFFASFEELMEMFYDDSFGEVKNVEELQDAFNEEYKRNYDDMEVEIFVE